MKEQILQLERHDDVNSARDKMGWTQVPRVLLVWPMRGRVLTRRLDLVLVKRHAEALGAQLGLVCQDAQVRDHASELGLPVFDTLAESRQHSWNRKRTPRLILRPWATRPKSFERPTPAPLSLPWAIPDTLVRILQYERYISFAAGLLAIFTLSGFIFPSATLVIRPVRQTISVTLPVVADVNADPEGPPGILPARTISATLEGTSRVATTGAKDVPSSKAQGAVVFTSLLGQATNIPKGTGLRTTTGASVRFVTTEASVMPAGRGQAVRVRIEAVDAGPRGNVATGLINAIDGSLGLQLAVVNDAATSGGGVEQRAAVTDEDRSRLRDQLLADLTQQAIAQLVAQLGEHERMPVETVRITRIESETYDRFPGEQADTLGLTLRVRAAGTVLDERTAEALARDALAEKVDPGTELVAGSEAVAWVSEPRLDEQGRLLFELSATAMTSARINPDAVRVAVRGTPPDAAARRLMDDFALQSTPSIQIQPPWFPRVPWLPFRIDVVVQTAGDG